MRAVLVVGVGAIVAAGAWQPPTAAASSPPSVAVTTTLVSPPPLPPAADVRLALAADGHVGAWLLSPTRATFGDASWKLAASDDAVDVAATLEASSASSGAARERARGTVAKNRAAWAAGVLHIENAGRHYVLVGADDGVKLEVDGREVYARDEARPRHEDDDRVAIDLAAGDHVVALQLRDHGGGEWKLRARILDGELQPPRGAWWWLPGTTAGDARAIATTMAAVSLDRGVRADGYELALKVSFPSGAPRGIRLAVHARLANGFDVDAGEVTLDDRGAVRDATFTLPRIAPGAVEDGDSSVHVDVAGRAFDFAFHPRRAVREAIARADRALSAAPEESIERLRDRLAAFVGKGDADVDAQLADARDLDDLSAALERKQDPYAARTGAMRRAYRSPADGKLSEFALWVPPDFDRAKRYPLIVALHGMNGHPMQMLMWLFGRDDPNHDGAWEDRHPRDDLPPLQAIVVAPDGHFNAMYREQGEDDVMRVLDWAIANYPVDEARVTITGPSMGGIGAAACALRHPDRFAAAEPLCGYHSYFVRGDIGGRPMRSWERRVAEERSNSYWAENGQLIPLYIVHGTRDLPEDNSGVLIDRYEDLRYSVRHEHPDLGHNVWQKTYEDLKGAKWLMGHRRPIHPRSVRFKTTSTRWSDDAWAHVRELVSSGAWGEVSARIDRGNVVKANTRGVADLALDRDAQRMDDGAPVRVEIDGTRLVFQAGEPIEAHREAGAWRAGAAHHEGPFKHGRVTGPIRDAFHEPLLFVWGASDPAQSRANEETARAWARVRPGVRVEYPVTSDADFFARGESIANDRALFLVGNARSNRVVREIEPSLPIRVEGDDVVVGDRRFASKGGLPGASQLGVAFVRPNPRRADRYVVVVEGVGPLGTWRSTSLPDMLPDWIVFDEEVAPARGQLLLGDARVRGGGLFDADWKLALDR